MIMIFSSPAGSKSRREEFTTNVGRDNSKPLWTRIYMIGAYQWSQQQDQAKFTGFSREDLLQAILSCCPSEGFRKPDLETMNVAQKCELFFDEVVRPGENAVAANPLLSRIAMKAHGIDEATLIGRLGSKALTASRMQQIWQETDPDCGSLIAIAKTAGQVEQMYDDQQIREKENIKILELAGLGGILELMKSEDFDCACVRRIARKLAEISPFLGLKKTDLNSTPYPAKYPNFMEDMEKFGELIKGFELAASRGMEAKYRSIYG